MHPYCLACSRAHEGCLGLQFLLQDDGSVETRFECCAEFQGYDGILHGGVTSTLLDAAMTNCLFAHGIQAVTAELNVRFRHPIQTDEFVKVSANIRQATPPLFIVEARLHQAGQCKAQSTGKFMQFETLFHEPNNTPNSIDLLSGKK